MPQQTNNSDWGYWITTPWSSTTSNTITISYDEFKKFWDAVPKEEEEKAIINSVEEIE